MSKGLKRICMNCGARFYDLNKNPIICPACNTEFTGEVKVKTRKTRATAMKEGLEAAKAKTEADAETNDMDDDDLPADDDAVLLDDDDDVVSINDMDDDEDDDDEDQLNIDAEIDGLDDIEDLEEDDDDLDDDDDNR